MSALALVTVALAAAVFFLAVAFKHRLVAEVAGFQVFQLALDGLG